ncbi:MAG: GGDEF domain-containing protein [Pseudomonadales bacterium]|nr:GGDEF domain-containing protein [Pseudomonadales bacterium]
MTSTLHNDNVFNLMQRLEPARALFSEKQMKNREMLLNLTNDLQTSLEIDDILHLFLNRIRTLVPVDGLTYTHEETAIHFTSTLQGKHKISYHLNSDQGDLGVLVFTRNHRYQPKELSIMENLIPCLRYPLRNALKYHQAITASTTDALTQCGNRQALDAALDREIALAQRDQTPLSVILFDFDHFKRINDQYGHPGGDQVLRLACANIKNSMRKTDLLFRYGGEEFVILLHKTNQDGALKVAERIRRQIESDNIIFKGQPIPITISLGLATWQEYDGINSIIERADKALYKAKRLGRNQVCSGHSVV